MRCPWCWTIWATTIIFGDFVVYLCSVSYAANKVVEQEQIFFFVFLSHVAYYKETNNIFFSKTQALY
jgi:hypothetical protein